MTSMYQPQPSPTVTPEPESKGFFSDFVSGFLGPSEKEKARMAEAQKTIAAQRAIKDAPPEIVQGIQTSMPALAEGYAAGQRAAAPAPESDSLSRLRLAREKGADHFEAEDLLGKDTVDFQREMFNRAFTGGGSPETEARQKELLKEIDLFRKKSDEETETQYQHLENLKAEIENFNPSGGALDLTPLTNLSDALYGTKLGAANKGFGAAEAQKVKLELMKDLTRQQSELRRDATKAQLDVLKASAGGVSQDKLLHDYVVRTAAFTKQQEERLSEGRKVAQKTLENMNKKELGVQVDLLDRIDQHIPGGLDNFEPGKAIPGVGKDNIFKEPIVGLDLLKQMASQGGRELQILVSDLEQRILNARSGTAVSDSEAARNARTLATTPFSNAQDFVFAMQNYRRTLRKSAESALPVDDVALRFYVATPNAILPDHPALVPKTKYSAHLKTLDEEEAAIDRELNATEVVDGKQ